MKSTDMRTPWARARETREDKERARLAARNPPLKLSADDLGELNEILAGDPSLCAQIRDAQRLYREQESAPGAEHSPGMRRARASTGRRSST